MQPRGRWLPTHRGRRCFALASWWRRRPSSRQSLRVATVNRAQSCSPWLTFPGRHVHQAHHPDSGVGCGCVRRGRVAIGCWSQPYCCSAIKPFQSCHAGIHVQQQVRCSGTDWACPEQRRPYQLLLPQKALGFKVPQEIILIGCRCSWTLTVKFKFGADSEGSVAGRGSVGGQQPAATRSRVYQGPVCRCDRAWLRAFAAVAVGFCTF